MGAYRFEDSRGGDCVARHLAGFGGLLQVDGYAAYNRLARSDRGNDAIMLAFADDRTASQNVFFWKGDSYDHAQIDFN